MALLTGRAKLVVLLTAFVFVFGVALLNLHSALPSTSAARGTVVSLPVAELITTTPPATPHNTSSRSHKKHEAEDLRKMFRATPQGPSVLHYDNGVWHLNFADPKGHYVPSDAVVLSDMQHNAMSVRQTPPGGTVLEGGVGEHRSSLTLSSALPNVDSTLTASWEVNSKPLCVVTCSLKEGGGHKTEITFEDKDVLVFGAPLRGQGEGITVPRDTKVRLFNRDIFRHDLNPGLGLYGTVPFVYVRHSSGVTYGLFWLNAADTEVTVRADGMHIESDGGGVEWFFLPGPTPSAVLKRYYHITGFYPMPPLFSLGYHQCRWSYDSAEDALQVSNKFLHHDIPVDTIWLDIDHTDQKMYFTWDHQRFPDPVGLQNALWNSGRRVITITDPHIKKEASYHVYKEGHELGAFVKDPSGAGDMEGHCWPGTSVWVDFTSRRIRDWYSKLFLFENYRGSTPTLFSWIDMNEPSVFNGPEVTLRKDVLHAGGVRHRDVHNAYGFYHAMSTYNGLLQRSNGTVRPFVLTRSFFAGSQRYAAVWTGDNQAKWEYLRASIAMVLTMSMAGIPHVGADIGGFFDDPAPELLTRWYQAGISYPFFRGHSHMETPRREPYLLDTFHRAIVKDAIYLRYYLLPYFYTLAHIGSQQGASYLRPLWFEFPWDGNVTKTWETYMIGPSLLIRPITAAHGVEPETSITFPCRPDWAPYEWVDFKTFVRHNRSGTVVKKFAISEFPLYVKAGSILPMYARIKTSTKFSHTFGYSLMVVLNSDGHATGNLYSDDETTTNYMHGDYHYQHYSFKNLTLTATPYNRVQPPNKGSAKAKALTKSPNTIKKIVIVGNVALPKLHGGAPLHAVAVQEGRALEITELDLPIDSSWTVGFEKR